MRFRTTRLGLLLTLTLASACSSSGKRTGPCTLGELDGCGTACSATTPCDPGLYCENGLCGAECTASSVARDCSSGAACSADGRCTGGGGSDGDGGGAGSDGSTADGGGSDGGGTGRDSSVCADVVVGTSAVTPNVIVIIDQSSSMNEALGDTTRWNALRDALLAEGGIFEEFQSTVAFGVALYSARAGEATCPLVTEVDVALNNLDAIRGVYGSAEPIADTPTGDSIDVVLESVRAEGLLEPDYPNPTIFILATDGEPDRCEELNPQRGQEEAVASVERAYEAGVRTYVIAVADEADISEQHLQDMANAGVNGSDAPSYRVNDDQGLRDTLRQLVNREVSCKLTLDGSLDPADACMGMVTLNGSALECNGADGFSVTGGSELTLAGDACDNLKAGGVLQASFPCDVVVLK
jgi:von Willebrand factor type A domain